MAFFTSMLVDFTFGVEIQDYSGVILQVNRPSTVHDGGGYKQGAIRSDGFLLFPDIRSSSFTGVDSFLGINISVE
jgi:hypothetical protein